MKMMQQNVTSIAARRISAQELARDQDVDGADFSSMIGE
jgi:hypothetical protein